MEEKKIVKKRTRMKIKTGLVKKQQAALQEEVRKQAEKLDQKQSAINSK